MRRIHYVCYLALPVGALLWGVGAAGAQGVDVRQACTPDAMRLCSEFIPDVAKITTCMHAKRAQLSQECRSAMGAGRHVGRRHAREGHVRHRKHHRG
jgi:hypothetical protein